MKRVLLLSTVLCLTLIFTGLNNVFSQDRDKTIKEIKSKDVVKTRNYNAHIQFGAPKNDKNPQPAPANKGGEEVADLVELDVVVDNFTGYYVEVYIDGVYKGTVSDWGTLNFTVQEPYTKLYCITSGGTKDWLVKGTFNKDRIWKLMK